MHQQHGVLCPSLPVIQGVKSSMHMGWMQGVTGPHLLAGLRRHGSNMCRISPRPPLADACQSIAGSCKIIEAVLGRQTAPRGAAEAVTFQHMPASWQRQSAALLQGAKMAGCRCVL